MPITATPSRRVLRSIAAVAMTVAGLITVPAAAHAQSGPVGWHGPAGVTCYPGATVNVTVRPSFERVGYGVAQYRAYRTWFQDIATGQWYLAQSGNTRDGWRYLPYEAAGSQTYFTGADGWSTRPSNYKVVLDYAWNVGSGWSVRTAWTGTYLISSGDFHGHPEGTCRTKPILQTVTGCNGFGGLIACASSARKTARPLRGRRGKLVRVQRHALTPPSDRAASTLQAR